MDYLYISNDPAENADNFSSDWAFLREMTTDEERFKAIRERWGNADTPDPKINLTYRHKKIRSSEESKENYFNSNEDFLAKSLPPPLANRKRKSKPSRRRSRSCTRPYEQLITNIHKNYEVEYTRLMRKQSLELQSIQNSQNLQTYLCYVHFNNVEAKEYLEMQQKKEVFQLLSSHYHQVQNVISRKNENITACKRFMEEVAAFFTFYQKINSDEITLQMTDSQYEHSVETEKMYGLYEKFYK